MTESEDPQETPFPPEERRRIEDFVRRINAEFREASLQAVIEAALAYHKQVTFRRLSDDEEFYAVWLAKKRRELERAIEAAYEALHPKPVAEAELPAWQALMEGQMETVEVEAAEPGPDLPDRMLGEG